MYSASVIQRNIERVEQRVRAQRLRDGQPLGSDQRPFRLVRFDPSISERMSKELPVDAREKEGKFTRELTPTERAFIDNELMMTMLDFQYGCERYFVIQMASESDRPEGFDLADAEEEVGSAGPRLGKFILNGMQIQLMKKLARLEDLCYEALDRGAPINGILLILHKARQLGASVLWQALIFHRVNFYSHINALVASIDDPATEMLFRRFWRIHDNLPFWMRSKIASQGRYEGVRFERDSLVQLQSGKQQKDLGKGETWHAVHVTEASVFERPEDHFDEGLFAAIPNSLYTLYGMEGTSKGKRGWWYDFVTAVMSGSARGGAGRFSHYFAPFYLIDMADSSRGQRSKYRIEAPLDWQPNLSTQMMLRRVESTSHLFCDIERLILHRDVAYWYESTRKYFDERGKLHIFRQNYPVDPNESFQHAAGGAFTNETIERLDGNVAEHSDSVWPYELLTSAEASESSSLISSDDHPVYRRGDYTLQPIPRIEIESSADRDPRGIIWIYEHPADRWFYVLGSDPTGGIPGWRRQFKQSSDINTDNGAIEIFRKDRSPQPCEDCLGRGWKPTSERGVLVECAVCRGRGKTGGAAVQCCEFAGPIDAEELAPYIWFLGRLYRGSSEFEECLAVIENNNTGILTIRTLQSKFDYTNLWQSLSQGAEITPRFTNAVGFYSGPTSVPILHARSRSIVTRKDADIRSPHLVKEYSDAIVKITGSEADAASKSIVVRERFTVPPGGGRHDDRMSASFLCYMILFDISDSVDGQESAAPSPAAVLIPDLASRDATAEEQRERWNRAAAEYVDAESIQLGGHYADCEPWCRADHGQDGEDDFGFDSDELDGEEGEEY
jgi:hypothetical protein